MSRLPEDQAPRACRRSTCRATRTQHAALRSAPPPRSQCCRHADHTLRAERQCAASRLAARGARRRGARARAAPPPARGTTTDAPRRPPTHATLDRQSQFERPLHRAKCARCSPARVAEQNRYHPGQGGRARLPRAEPSHRAPAIVPIIF